MAFNSPYYGGQQYPMYQSPYPQPYQPPQMAQPPVSAPIQPQSGLNRVTGIEGARAFAVSPNSVVALFDDTQDVFYVKSTDSGGFPTLKAYRFAPMEDTPQSQPTGLTRTDIEQIVREELKKYEQQFIPTESAYTAPPEYKRPKQHDGTVRSVSAADAGAQSSAAPEQSA